MASKRRPAPPQQQSTDDRAQPIWQKAFLTALKKTGNVTKACRAAKIDRTTPYRHRESDEEFARLWDEAIDESADLLEAEALRRAVTGWNEPVFQGGRQVGTIRKYSDPLLVLLLKANKPDKFRERHDITSDGKPVPIAVVKMDVDEL